MQKIEKFLPLIFLLIFLSLLRIAYYFHAPGIFPLPDTIGYYDFGRIIFENPSYFINDGRLPLYPLFLGSVMLATGRFGEVLGSAGFQSSMAYAILIQSFSGLASLVILYGISRLLKIPRIISLILVAAAGMNIHVFGWERVLLTETFTVLLLLLLARQVILLILKPRAKGYALYLLLSLLLMFLKPLYSMLPAVMLPVLVLHRRKISIGALSSLAVFYSVVIFAVMYNGKHFSYYGLNRISEINLFGKVLQLKLDPSPAEGIPYFFNLVSSCYPSCKPMPYEVLEKDDPEIYTKPEAFNGLREFNTKVISGNLGLFFSRSLLQFPEALFQTSEIIILSSPGANLLSPFFRILFDIYKWFQPLGLAVFPLAAVSLFLFLKSRDVYWKAIFSLGLMSSFQIASSVFLSYGEYARLISPAWPVIYIFISAFTWKAISGRKKRVHGQ